MAATTLIVAPRHCYHPEAVRGNGRVWGFSAQLHALRSQPNWGIVPWNPVALRDRAYAPFVAALRRNMQSASALRIDHVMGLLRLYWVPKGRSPAEGGYVHYPFDDLLGIVTLESQRNRCMVIGEDLGTVLDEVREALRPCGVLSSRLLYFERNEEDSFKEPAAYEPQALLAVSTHDLPTLTGVWQGVDLDVRRQLALFPSNLHYEEQLLRRTVDRAHLLLSLEREELLPPKTSVDPVSLPELTAELVQAVHRHVARTPCRLMLLQLADLLGQTAQVNLPGSGESYPNWRQRLPLALETWAEQHETAALWRVLRGERGQRAAQQRRPTVAAVTPPPKNCTV